MAKKKQGKQIKGKKSYIEFLKLLTKWLGTKNRDYDQLPKLASFYNIKTPNLLLRMCTYAYNNPHIIWYINEYLNHLYQINQFNNYDLGKTVGLIFDQNNHNSTNNFYFLKSTDEKDPNKKKVKDVVKQYGQFVHDRMFNDMELNYFYSLFERGVLSEDDIENLNSQLGNEKSLNLEPIQQQTTEENKQQFDEYFEEAKTTPLSGQIQKFVDEIKTEKQEREKCQQCKLFDKSIVVLDTNVQDFQPVDFMFIALNPGKDERFFDKPLVGRSGKLHREKMFQMHPNTTWLITNAILCSTNSQKEIGSKDKEIMEVANLCGDNLIKIINKFKARYYVLIGRPAMTVFGIKGSIVQNSGEIIESPNGAKMIPLVHPSAVIQYHGNMEKAFNAGFDNIINISHQLHEHEEQTIKNIDTTKQTKTTKTTNSAPQSNSSFTHNLPADKVITEVTDDLTFFDAAELDGKHMLKIYIDEYGGKKYKVEEYKIPIYVKTKQAWDNCDMIENIDDMDNVVYLSGYNRYKTMQKARDNLSVQKKSCTQ